jgi:dimethylhistidine N-methyltransferase
VSARPVDDGARTALDSPESARERFAADVADSLRRTPRQLPSRYFYDALGSALFEAICRLPWYQVTRAESLLLERHAQEILRPWPRQDERSRPPLQLAELGCGSGEKLGTLIDGGGAAIGLVQLVDVSAAALQQAREHLDGRPVAAVIAHQQAYEDGLVSMAANRAPDAPLAVLFLGSNIGNFDPPADRELLTRIHAALQPGDALILGTDLVKPARDLLLAYDDPLQVTAAFNRNLLRRINEELGGTFELGGFRHEAVWNETASRMEMHLVSTRRQHVAVRAAGLELTFEPDDRIWTESSYKYQPEQVAALGQAAGFTGVARWIDRAAGFALTRFTV